MLINILLISFFANPLEIIAVSNIGSVFATCGALSGFLLLRKDRPAWPRPVRLPSIWVPIGLGLFAIHFVFLLGRGVLCAGGVRGIRGSAYGWDKHTGGPPCLSSS